MTKKKDWADRLIDYVQHMTADQRTDWGFAILFTMIALAFLNVWLRS